MSGLNKRPSLIPQKKEYKGLGRAPDSKIPENKGYRGLGRSPEAKIDEQIKKIDKKLAEDAKQRGQEPPPPILPKGSDMTFEEKKEAVRNARASYLDRLEDQNEGKPADGEMTLDQKLEAVRNAKSSITEKNSDELSQRPSAPPSEQPSEAPAKQQFRITTDVVEEKPERPELVDDTTSVEEPQTPHPWKVTATSSGSVNIAEGYIMGYYTQYTDEVWGALSSPLVVEGDESAYAVVLAAGYHFQGGNIPVTGSKFIYVEVSRTDPPLVYAEAGVDLDIYVEVELGDQARPPDYTSEPHEVSGVPTIVLSDSPPHLYMPSSNNLAVCIAKATNVDGVVSVKQYFTHNPTVFFPVVNVIGSGSGGESPP